jgi:hypothetical protein
MRNNIFFVMVVISQLIISVSAWAIPDSINYQGSLTDSENISLTGIYGMQFYLCDDLADGVCNWYEEQDVEVSDGTYSVLLGSVIPIPVSIFEIDSLYLEVRIHNGSEWEILSPRQLVTSTPYAIKAADAETLDGQHAADFAGVVHDHSGLAITSGAVAEERIAASIARDSEIMPIVLGGDGPGSGLDADLLDGYHEFAFQKQISGSCGNGYSIRAVNNDGTVVCEQDNLGITTETDPKIGTLSVGRWCATNGTLVNCIYETPASADHEHDADYVNVTGNTTTENLNVNSAFRIQNDIIFTGGKGLELAYNQSSNTGNIRSYDRTTNTWGKLYLGNGNVGIGTKNPTSPLTVQSSAPAVTLNTTGNVASYTIQKNSLNRWSLGWNDGSGYLYFYDWAAPGGTRMVIDDDTGNVGIGEASPAEKLVVAGNFRVQDNANNKAYRFRTSGDALDFDFYKENMYFSAYDAANNQSIIMLLHNERKNIGIGDTNPQNHVKLTVDSGSKAEAILAKGSSIGVVAYGGSYDFYANGTGANYGPFTGAHDVSFSNDFPYEILPGTIVSVTGETQVRMKKDGSVSLSSTLPSVELSNKANDKAVLGVLVKESFLPTDHWYDKNEGKRFGIVNALGEGRVWVTDVNGTIETGDYITTSSIAGYGQRQDDDLLHSYTLGKAIETVDWDAVSETVEFKGKDYNVYLIAVVYTSG